MRKLTQEQFLEKASAAWPDYDFSEAVYVDTKTHVKYSCPKHGPHSAKPGNLFTGYGCPACGLIQRAETRTDSQEEFLAKVKQVHPDYDFSESVYGGSKVYVNYRCANKNHGIQKAWPSNIISGKGCRECGTEKRIDSRKSSIEDFLEKMKDIRPGYDFSKSVYTNCKTRLAYTCDKGHEWTASPNNLLTGYGCPKCAAILSRSEEEVASFIESLGVETVRHRRLENNKEMDIFIPSLNMAIEYNGLFWHNEEKLGKTYHLDKLNQCKSQGISLIQIFEDEWLHKKELVKSRLLSKLGMSTKIFARKTEVRLLDATEASEFIDNHHLQGFGRHCPIRLGLFEKDSLVAVMTFAKQRKAGSLETDFELVRYCSKGTVVGGFSKLVTFFLRNYQVSSILSYSDKRWSEGNVYEVNGFIHEGSTEAGYFWCRGSKRFHREQFQKHKLADILKTFDETLSEKENCELNGYFRVFDCGHDRWILNLADGDC